VTAGKHLRNGLNPDETIAREGALARVPGPFQAVVEAARTELATAFGGRRMHSAYLYGSIPRGTAIPGTSDLDLLVALNDEPTPADRNLADGVERGLDGAFAVINGAGLLLYSAAALLSELERHDLGFFVACLCTPLIGPDLGGQLPRYRPTSLLARETNGDLALVIPRWRSRLAEAGTAPGSRPSTPRSTGPRHPDPLAREDRPPGRARGAGGRGAGSVEGKWA
jgi:uncharacterized protein